MKHIIIQVKLPNGMYQAFPIIFSKFIVHKDMFESMKKLFSDKTRYNYTDIKCISAGDYNNGYFSGKSTSLDINSHKLAKGIVDMIRYIPFYEQSLE